MRSENLAMFLQFIIADVTAKTISANGQLSKKVTWSKCNVKTAADDTASRNLWLLIDRPEFDMSFPTNFTYPGCF